MRNVFHYKSGPRFCVMMNVFSTNSQSTLMGWLLVTVILGGNHYLRVRL